MNFDITANIRHVQAFNNCVCYEDHKSFQYRLEIQNKESDYEIETRAGVGLYPGERLEVGLCFRNNRRSPFLFVKLPFWRGQPGLECGWCWFD